MEDFSITFDPALLVPPARYPDPPPPDYAPEVSRKIQGITEHFSLDGYALPVHEENKAEKRALSEREMMFLVR